MNGIEVKNVKKSFGNVEALRGVSFTLEPNKIYGFLGRNGAGKTTLLNCITNRIFPEEGGILVDGEKAQENDRAQSKIYMMSEKTYYPEGMSIADVFRWTKEFYPDFDMNYANQLAQQFDLKTNKKVKKLSTGYSSIFKLIVALSVNVPYLFFDEPVLGLDANHRELFYRVLVEKYSEKPCTIVISTHLIEEVAGVLEEVIIIKDGQIIKKESCESLLEKGYTVSGSGTAVDRFAQGKEVIGMDTLGGLKSAYILGKVDRSTLPSDVEITKLDLQRLFIQLTN